MKRNLTALFFLSLTSSLFATFNFSSKDSTIRVGSQAQFYINTSITGFNGTLDILSHNAGRIAGSDTITFQNGFLGNEFSKATFSGIYNPTYDSGNDRLVLQGSASTPHRIYAASGMGVREILVQGGYNIIEGAPEFAQPIVFDGDLNTTLSVGIQSKLNKNIELKGGRLILVDDLALADDVMLTDSGTVILNKRTLHMPGAESTWTTSLLFDNASDIELHARTELSGTWTFSGESVLNGNGCVLDMTSGGALRVVPGATLQINDIMIKGVGVGLGTFDFESDASKIVFSKVIVELENTYTTNMGSIYVDGSSEVIVKDHVWWFDGTGTLSVDGVTLWTDRAGAATGVGLGIDFGLPESAHYTSIASGTIKMASSAGDFSSLQSLVISNSNAIVNTWDLAVSNSYAIIAAKDNDHLFPGDYLRYSTNTVVDGNGRHYVFSHWSQPQFIVDPGVTVELRNIEFFRINENTFRMGAGSKLKIGPNVLFEIVEDVIWEDGTIELTGDNTIFTIRGMDGTKKFTFQHTCVYTDVKLDLGTGTLLLENIELWGLHLFDGSTKMRDRYFQLLGAVALGGNSIMNVEYKTAMHFKILGSNNEFRLHNNDIRFTGNLLYGNRRENELHMRFFLRDSMAIPKVIFANQFMHVESTSGIARLIFDDALVRVYNEDGRAFIVGNNSFLKGRRIELSGNPIIQTSQYFELDADTQITGAMDNVITQEFIRSPFTFGRTGPKLVTALDSRDLPSIRESTDKKSFVTGGTDLFVRNSTIKLSAAANTIQVDKGTITEFGVSSSDELTLTLKNGGTLQQKDGAVTFKSGDQLSIEGTDNTILVKDQLTINGSFSMAEQSELTFEFDAAYENPVVYFGSGGLIDIAKGARLRCKGPGTIRFADGSRIVLRGTVNGQRSEFALQDSAKLELDTSAAMRLWGNGRVLVDTGAQMHVASDSQLMIGYYEWDSLEILVDHNGGIAVESTLSFARGTYSIDFLRNSRLAIENGGVVEINSLNEQATTQGLLTRLTFQDGTTLRIASGGKLLFGANKLSSGVEIPFTLNTIKSTFSTGGLVGLVSSSFVGTLQNNLSSATSVTALNCVRLLINAMPALSVSTLFYDASGNQKVRTKDGVVVSLLSGDTIISDDATTGIISGLNNREPFEITAQGVRV